MYLAVNRNGDPLNGTVQASKSETWLEAAKDCMKYDGYTFELRRVNVDDCRDENDEIDASEVREHFGYMALWVKNRHHGNNVYAPRGILNTRGDFTGIFSENDDDEEAEEECLRAYGGNSGLLHPRRGCEIVELEYDDAGELQMIGLNTVEQEAESLDCTVEEVRARYA